ncbi:carbohydrate-selective porin B [Neokomagataea thailandica NBRC 106555]|uniref:Carbohydrate porin n=2 Tax=Neokomagataea TaxID=1223423 RepID=A0A4Y6V6D2_9PROT|nr:MULTISPECIES: carbohydrate porin [Neokomagataea]QDH24161.1 carbohydrate porin [Neokomagataea tanensis]GBR50563.1 carbohydrate-selective porin B [Neokomagataea thailandica NBRC 106555]
MKTSLWYSLGLRTILCCTALGSFSAPALAQSTGQSTANPQDATNPQGAGENGEGPAQRVNAPLGQVAFSKGSVPPLPQPEALLPDPFGWNTYLRSHGVAIMLDNTNEFGGALTKPTPGYGLRQGSSNAGQYSLETDIDWERLAGITGFSTHAVAVGRYGIPASRMFGDLLMNPSSEIYGSGGNVVVHLVYFYGEETMWHGRLDVAAGRMPLLSDFSANPLYCNFMNNAFCGNPKASSDNTTHSSYPDAVWSARVRVRPTQATYIQTGVYFSQAGIYGVQQYRTGFKLNGADINGEAIPVEAGWEPSFKHGTLPGHYKVGYVWDTAEHNDNYYDMNGNSFVLSGLSPRKIHGSWSAWALADQMVYHHPGGTPNAGVTVLGGAYFNNEQTQTRAQWYGIGVLDRGFWKSRPLDAMGVNFAYVRASGRLSKTQALQLQYGEPLQNGAYGVQRFGMVLEAMYQIHVYRGITFAPDFQYFWNPGLQPNLRDAAMLGFKAHIQMF